MNIARCFSYTLELEEQLKKLQQRFDKLEHEAKTERKAWEQERKELMDRLLAKQGVPPIHKASVPNSSNMNSVAQPKPFELPRLSANREAKKIEQTLVKSVDEMRQAAQKYRAN